MGKKILVYTGNGGIMGETFNSFGQAAGRTIESSDTFPADLSDDYCVLLPANTDAFTTPQKAALKAYALSGGTIVAMAENQLFPGGPPSTVTMNALASYAGVGLSGGSDAIDPDYHSTSVIGASPYTAGVTTIGYAFTNRVYVSPPASALVGTQNRTTFIGVQQVGLGKFVYSGDVNIFSDYLGAPYVVDNNKRFVKNLCGDTQPPEITITTPPNGARYKKGTLVNADWGCTDLDGDVDPDPAKTFATKAVGQLVDTDAPAGQTVTKSFSVTCTDLVGNTATKTVNYVVDASPPDVIIDTPVDAGSYDRNSLVPAAWSCSDVDGPADIDTAPNKTFGTKQPGEALDTEMPLGGAPIQKSFSATCTDKAGNSATKTVQYTVADHNPPIAAVTTPVAGTRFLVGAQPVLAAWSCTDPDGPQDIDPDENKTFGTLPVGAQIDTTGTAGQTTQKSFTVTCTDLAGNVDTETITYFVDGSPPVVTIAVPVDGGTYPRGSSQPANWSCADLDGDADIKSKVATLPLGTPINTSTLGVKTFTVTCTDQAGNVATRSVSYTVVGGPPTVTIASPVDGKTYDQGQVVAPTYSCADADNDLKSCVRAGGTGPVDTSKGGTFTFTVNAEDLAGNTATKTVRYTVKAKVATPGTAVSPTSKPGATKVCTSRRQFRIRVKKLKGGVKAVSATVFVNGKKTLTRRGKRVTAIVTLKGLKKGQYKVKINVKYSNGRVLSYTRKFKTCTPKGK